MVGLSPAEERATRDAPGWAVCSLRPGAVRATRGGLASLLRGGGMRNVLETSSRGENTGRGETRAHTIIDNALITNNIGQTLSRDRTDAPKLSQVTQSGGLVAVDGPTQEEHTPVG